MGRSRVLNVGAINIKMHPHSPGKYVDLLKMAYQQTDRFAKIHGSDWGTIGALYEYNNIDGFPVLGGEIYRFLNIDPHGTWLNLIERQPINADKDDIVPPVPDYLKPNLKQIPYLFFPSKHRLFFERRSITPRGMRLLFESLFMKNEIENLFGKIDVSTESTSEVIEKILKIPRMTKLEIIFSIPNADELGEIEERVLERINQQNIRKQKQISRSTDEEGIKPDEETKAFMNIARSNGEVRAEGYDGEMKRFLSTENHPLTQRFVYDDEQTTKMQALLLASTSMLNKISKN